MTHVSQQDSEREKRLMAMGEMAASLAHEIRNPLGSMELFCTLLKKDLTAQPDSLRLAEQIHESIKTLDRIIGNCLQFSRDIKPKLRAFDDLNPFLDEILTAAKPRAMSCHVDLACDTTGEGVAHFDPYLMNQALLNLVLNAIDAAHEAVQLKSVEKGRVRVTSDLSDVRTWRVAVEDNGVGIPEEQYANIFDPFFTTKDEGTGLGLAVTHTIVATHGGSIEIESAVGEGTVVAIEIPREGD